MSVLDPATRTLVAAAAGLFESPEEELTRRFLAVRQAGAAWAWLEELVLSAVLFVGFPRALVAAAVMRKVQPLKADVRDATSYENWREWLARGEQTCRRIYGDNYYKLRNNVFELHPALDMWIVVDGYGRTLSRPGLDPRRRELCAIAMLVPQDASRQLHSHFAGALNVGASREEIEEVLDVVEGCGMAPARIAAARSLWAEVGHRDFPVPGPRSPLPDVH